MAIPLLPLVTVAGFFLVLFVVAQLRKDNSIADIGWGVGFVISHWVALLESRSLTSYTLLLVGLVTIWGIRLAVHIFNRNQGKPEDSRYQEWRRQWGNNPVKVFLGSLLKVFLLQALLMAVIAWASWQAVYMSAFTSPWEKWWLIAGGLLLWIIGFLFEVVGDYQLAVFKKNPQHRGRLITSGLWKYTRHPNYFGEALLWWGIWLVSLAATPFWWTVISPLTISCLVRFVSGVPLLEKKMQNYPGFEAYQAQTSIFFPRLPKSSSSGA